MFLQGAKFPFVLELPKYTSTRIALLKIVYIQGIWVAFSDALC